MDNGEFDNDGGGGGGYGSAAAAAGSGGGGGGGNVAGAFDSSGSMAAFNGCNGLWQGNGERELAFNCGGDGWQQ